MSQKQAAQQVLETKSTELSALIRQESQRKSQLQADIALLQQHRESLATLKELLPEIQREKKAAEMSLAVLVQKENALNENCSIDRSAKKQIPCKR